MDKAVVIIIRGGMVEEIHHNFDHPVRVVAVDFDMQEGDFISGDECLVTEHEPLANSALIEEVMEKADAR